MKTETVTLQSRMNIDFCRYDMARKYIETLPYDQWVYVCDIPEAISYEVIDLIDGRNGDVKIVFCETFEKFIVTRCIPVIATLNLTRYYRNVEPVKQRELTSNFKGVSWRKNKHKYQSQIGIKNTKFHLGYFKNEKYAAIAYQIAEINKERYYGRE